MSPIELFLVVIFALLVVLYLRAWFRISNTNDVEIIRTYQWRFPFQKLANRRLYEVYSRQLDVCTSADTAERIYNGTANSSNDNLRNLSRRAQDMWSKIVSEELADEFEKVKENEDSLITFIKRLRRISHVVCGNFQTRAMEALRPFTEKRIHEATSVLDLKFLCEDENQLFVCGLNRPVDRIDDFLKVLYTKKLREVVLRDAYNASGWEDLNWLCFHVATGDHVIDALVAMKGNLLSLSPQVNSFWTSGTLRKEIDQALKIFLDRNS